MIASLTRNNVSGQSPAKRDLFTYCVQTPAILLLWVVGEWSAIQLRIRIWIAGSIQGDFSLVEKDLMMWGIKNNRSEAAQWLAANDAIEFLRTWAAKRNGKRSEPKSHRMNSGPGEFDTLSH